MWKKLVTRESTLLERTLRFKGYAEFLPHPFSVKQKDLLAVYEKGMATQYVMEDDYNSKIKSLEEDLNNIGFYSIIKKWDDVFDNLLLTQNNLLKSLTCSDWEVFMGFYKESRAIILYTHNLAKLLKSNNCDQSQIEILQKYYDSAELKSSGSWKKLSPFFDKIKNDNSLGDEIYSYTEEEFSNLLSGGIKINKVDIDSREEITVLLLKDYKYEIFFGDEAKKVVKLLNIDDTILQNSKIVGSVAYKGVVTGKVVVVTLKEHYKKILEGDVLVTTMTDPSMVTFLPKISAIVTDEGGILCHASIISRELKKPCIIGTKDATKILKDGDMVEVDAENGIVRIIK
jgi:phosphohistidine swiveling domain-containing protein